LSATEHDADGWWETRYREGHTPWDREAPSPALDRWLESGRLRPGRIVVPGCGRGHEVIELARRGFAVVALDFAPTPLALLRQRLTEQGLTADVLQVDMFEWRPARPFDAIYDQTSLCALRPGQWRPYANKLYDWLRPGGHLFALFMQTHRPGGPPYHCDLDEMRRVFPVSRWCWPATAEFELPHPVGYLEHAYVLQRQPQD
jgi:SAM-dependent methyltransferase